MWEVKETRILKGSVNLTLGAITPARRTNEIGICSTARLGNLLGNWGCADTGQLLPSSPAGLRNSSNWTSASTNITLGTDQLGESATTSTIWSRLLGGLKPAGKNEISQDQEQTVLARSDHKTKSLSQR